MTENPRTIEESLHDVKSGMRVFVHGGAAFPARLVEGLLQRGGQQAGRLRDVELIHLHTEGPARYADPEYSSSFRVANLFVGSNIRHRLDGERVDYLPIFLSEIPALFRSRKRPIDVALLHVSPPDIHGYCSLGVSVDVAAAAASAASLIIAQINPQMPRVQGDGLIHSSRIHRFVEVDDPLPVTSTRTLSDAERRIGENVSSLVEDGSTLQVGIGAVPEAVLASLGGHRHLGLHTEMWSDGALELIQRGVIDNSRKEVHPGKTVSTFLFGSRSLYDFVHDNPAVAQFGADYVNSPITIARNPKVVAVNSAVMIDLSGQVCADSIGRRVISGVGGQMDFIRGAALSEGGKPIIALTSRARGGQPRIVSALPPGSGVVTTRAHVHYVVTEYGIADLFGKTLGERARELIRIAHPEDREALAREWRSGF